MLKDMLVSQRWVIQDDSKLQLFSMNTPNGQKVAIALEETGIPFEAHLVDITKGDQHDDAFVAISPNSKIPVIVDPNGPNGRTVTIMESGAILIYLADKAGLLLPVDPVERNECLQWLFFQVGHIGPMFGQFGHSSVSAKIESNFVLTIRCAPAHTVCTELMRQFLVVSPSHPGPQKCGRHRAYRSRPVPCSRICLG